MEIDDFLNELKAQLKSLNFVDDFTVITKTGIELRVKIILKPKGFLNVWYNMITRNQSFSIIINNDRKWAVDKDTLKGWHEHPIDNPKNHLSISEQTISQIINKVKRVWYKFS